MDQYHAGTKPQGLATKIDSARQRQTENLRNYHLDSLYGRNGANSLIHEDKEGRPVTTTVNVMGLQVGDKIYNVPGYNNKTGEMVEEGPEMRQKLLGMWGAQIEANPDMFPSFDAKFDGPIQDHPANIAARDLHAVIDEDMKQFQMLQQATTGHLVADANNK